eukprot:1254058-Ditylum_brightwellii.AAC.1
MCDDDWIDTAVDFIDVMLLMGGVMVPRYGTWSPGISKNSCIIQNIGICRMLTLRTYIYTDR